MQHQPQWGLMRPAFQQVADPRYYCRTAGHEHAVEVIKRSVAERKGFVLVVGPAGVGKTLLARLIQRELLAETTVVYTSQSRSPEQLWTALEAHLDRGRSSPKAIPAERADTVLARLERTTRPVVWCVDEAHTLSDEALELIRRLNHLENEAGRVVQLILLGWPSVGRRLAAMPGQALSLRCAAVVKLGPLSLEEVKTYVSHRAAAAGAMGDSVANEQVIAMLHETSGGVPARINQIAELALAKAEAQCAMRLEAAHVTAAAAELSHAERKAWPETAAPTAIEAKNEDNDAILEPGKAERRLQGLCRALGSLVDEMREAQRVAAGSIAELKAVRDEASDQTSQMIARLGDVRRLVPVLRDVYHRAYRQVEKMNGSIEKVAALSSRVDSVRARITEDGEIPRKLLNQLESASKSVTERLERARTEIRAISESVEQSMRQQAEMKTPESPKPDRSAPDAAKSAPISDRLAALTATAASAEAPPADGT